MDREKVIKGLECCQYSSKPHCDGCPYVYDDLCSTNDCTADLASEALSLLKEQETIVRCKDCKYCHIHGNGYDINCLAGHNITYTDGFCSEGKKRETSKEE